MTLTYRVIFSMHGPVLCKLWPHNDKTFCQTLQEKPEVMCPSAKATMWTSFVVCKNLSTIVAKQK